MGTTSSWSLHSYRHIPLVTHFNYVVEVRTKPRGRIDREYGRRDDTAQSKVGDGEVTTS